jgi:hypothetical protein
MTFQLFMRLSSTFRRYSRTSCIKRALLATLQKTDGRLFDYRLEPSSRLNASAHPTIQAELRKPDPLVNLAMHFAQRRIFAESAASYSQMGSFGHGLEFGDPNGLTKKEKDIRVKRSAIREKQRGKVMFFEPDRFKLDPIHQFLY